MSWEKQQSINLGGAIGETYKNGALQVIVTKDPPDDRWHLSISHPHRYPTWEEIKRARYDLLPDAVTMAMLLPPKSEYVNVHSNCFHLHEWREKEVLVTL